ncbi:MAG: MurR/RpiR family transcriptional regulator [Aggregatilineales bacterium]
MTRKSSRGPAGLSENAPEGLLVRLAALRESLSPVSKRVIDYILEYQDEIVHMSVSEVAAAVGVSIGSVVRVCQQIGMKGFQDLKIALARELVEPMKFIHEDVARTDDTATIIDKVLASDMKALVDTMKVLDPHAMQRAVDYILNAERVEFYGIGSAAPIAVDIYYRMLRIGINCVVSIDSHMQAVSASLTHEKVVVLTISHSGSTRETVDAMRLAKQAGAKTICITNYGKSPIQDYADVVLYTAATETLFRTEAMTSRIAQLSVADALYICVAMARFEKSLENINRTADALVLKRY